MKYFLFSITNLCNKSCDYCIVKPWVNNPEFPSTVAYGEAVDYFSTRLGKGDVLEITGGEPTLVPWLGPCIQFIGTLGARVLLRTNGFKLFQNRYDFLTVVFNPHGDNALRERVRPLLKKGDLIINPAITKEDKPVFDPYSLPGFKTHPFTETRFIYICISGGEPFIRPDLRDICEFGKDRGHKIIVNSNLSLIDGSMEWIKKSIDMIFVGFHPNQWFYKSDPLRKYYEKIQLLQSNGVKNFLHLASRYYLCQNLIPKGLTGVPGNTVTKE
jgi:organic radical activating enzyme